MKEIQLTRGKTIQEQLKINGPKVVAIYKVNTFQIAGMMRKEGCPDELINYMFEYLIRHKERGFNPYSMAKTYIKDFKITEKRIKEKEDKRKLDAFSKGFIGNIMRDAMEKGL